MGANKRRDLILLGLCSVVTVDVVLSSTLQAALGTLSEELQELYLLIQSDSSAISMTGAARRRHMAGETVRPYVLLYLPFLGAII